MQMLQYFNFSYKCHCISFFFFHSNVTVIFTVHTNDTVNVIIFLFFIQKLQFLFHTIFTMFLFFITKTLHNLGNVYGLMGQSSKAAAVYKDAIARQNRIETPSQKLLVS